MVNFPDAVVSITQNSNLYIFQKGFNYSQDGPGNRLVYHLSGCNMLCPWCSNPEGMKRSIALIPTPVEELVKEAENARMIFIDGGGVTFTGGEATVQRDALLNAVRLLKSKGISTCIETNASLPECDELFNEIDYMIADFKSPDSDMLQKICGGDLDQIKKNLLYRVKTGKPLLVRIPLIKYFNCGEENARCFAEFFKALRDASTGAEPCFEILPYHEFGKDKYNELGRNYTVTDGFVSDNDINVLLSQGEKYNLKFINT